MSSSLHKRNSEKMKQRKKKNKYKKDIENEKIILARVNKLPEDLLPVIFSFIPYNISEPFMESKINKYRKFLKQHNCLSSFKFHQLGIMMNKVSLHDLCNFIQYGSIANYWSKMYSHMNITMYQATTRYYNVYTHKFEYGRPVSEWDICVRIKSLLDDAFKRAYKTNKEEDVIFAGDILRNIIYVCKKCEGTTPLRTCYAVNVQWCK